MKIKKGFKLRTVLGEPVIMCESATQVNFNKIITLNDSAAMLWKSVEGKDFTAEDLAEKLLSRYDVDRETALADATEIASQWLEVGIVD